MEENYMKNYAMENDELYTTVEIGGDTYRIQKFTARDGLKLARLVLAKIAPIVPLLPEHPEKPEAQQVKGADKQTTKPKAADVDVDSKEFYSAVSLALDSLDDKDMDYLMDKCLRVCCKMLPAGPTPIIDEFGHYAIPEVEYDMTLTLQLVVSAIKWGASDFFAESGFDLKALLNLVGK